MIAGYIDDTLARRVAGFLRLMKDEPVTLRINSTGGVLAAAIDICECVRAHGNVTTMVVGVAESGAFLVALAGQRRLIARHASMWMHHPKEIMEEAQDAEKWASAVVATNICIRTKHNPDLVLAWLDAEMRFNATEAVQAGLADAVIEVGRG
jgi:ATP-dependent Clp protease, protease subunit